MFEEFYELSSTPFSRDIPSNELYSSIALEEVLGRLKYAAQRQLFAILTGDCGIGKTTAIRKFKDMLNPSEYIVMYLSDSKEEYFAKKLSYTFNTTSTLVR